MAISREVPLKILGQMKDSEIDYSEISVTDEAFWQDTMINIPSVKVPATIRIESDVLTLYKECVPSGD